MIRKATHDDVPAIAETLAAAFSDDPFNAWLLPDADRRSLRLADGMAQQVALSLRRDGCWTTDDCEGAALWAPPGTGKMGTAEQLRMLPGLARVMGLPALPRVLSAFGTMEKHQPDEPHWYLAIMGVRPEAQGRRIGSQLLEAVLPTCDRDGVGAYLETANKDNLRLYQRHGFAVRDEFDLTAAGPHIWTMWRPSRSTST